jgi:hypothetical protein
VPVEVTLRHGGTGLPVSGALVSPSYQYFMDPFHPDVDERITDAQGRAVIPVAPSERFTGFFIRSHYKTDSPEGEQLIRLPEDKLNAVRRAAEDARQNPVPIPFTIQVLPLGEWLEKYRGRAK